MRPVRFLFDENAARRVETAVRRRWTATECFRVGKRDAPPIGTLDPALLIWCEAEHAIFVSLDKKTLPGHMTEHYRAGRRIWGIFIVRRRAPQRQLLEDLLTVAGASSAEDWLDRLEYLPFPRPALVR